MTIRAEHIAFSYGNNTPVLHDVNLEIAEGTLTVLCGVTGSGKSTLLRLLAGLDTPAGGSISYTEEGQAEKAMLVFQQPEAQLFAGSVHKEVEYGLAEHGVPHERRTALIQDALHSVGLSYETYAERSPFLLSGGEKRRLCIACALPVSPELLILDEPTAGLDPQAAASLVKLATELRKGGTTLIIATHDLDSFLHLADQVIVMSQGAVLYDGPANRLLTDPEPLELAGLEQPVWARIGQRLLLRGLVEKPPEHMDGLLAGLDKRPLPIPDNAEAVPPEASGPALPRQDGREQPRSATAGMTVSAAWRELDPRVKWVGMALGSLVIVGMRTALPLFLATVLIAGLIVSARIPRRRTVRFFRPFLLMFLFIWLVAGLDWSTPDYSLGPLGFSLEGLQRGGLSVWKFLLLIALGFLFTETTTGAPLREGLEWAIAPLHRLGIRTRNWSLAVTVTLQFIPWILDRLAQLQLALRSRGRQKSGPVRWRPRHLKMLIVPLLIMIIGMGDELSTAIESRGYNPDTHRTAAFRLRWRTTDTMALIGILLAAAALWWCSRIG